MSATTSRPVIAIAGPSYFLAQEEVDAATAALLAAGCEVKIAPNVTSVHGHFAGTDNARAEGLMSLCGMKDVDFILMARGGNGALRMLPHLDWKRVGTDVPWIGFSDSTALLNARAVRTGAMGWHAPMFRQLMNDYDTEGKKLLGEIFQGNPPKGYGAPELDGMTVLKHGETEGTLWGGNVGVLRSLCGTPWLPKPKPGDIVFLEDLFTNDWQVDRDLEQLSQCGFFDNLGGVIFGTFSEIFEYTAVPFGFSMTEIFERHTQPIKGPVVMDFPAGHAGPNLPLPIGGRVQLKADAHGVTVTFEGAH